MGRIAFELLDPDPLYFFHVGLIQACQLYQPAAGIPILLNIAVYQDEMSYEDPPIHFLLQLSPASNVTTFFFV